MIGTTLGHYQITSRLGKGGMGEVYRAKDQKLGRDVAIKVLPEEFARDTDRVARFQREAKLLASLNHPNIAAIYGLEESGGTNFLVLELVEGDTLAERIKTGPIPAEESLKLGLQIAEALEAAHEKGVIHRDLKPANVKVTPEGKVKVLDFGLAKAFAGDQAELNLSNSPTLSDMATQQGVILGTAAYMSPEQARGKPVDKRADVWAFGVVLFEMMAGRQIFAGDTVSDTLAAVLKLEPEWKNLPKEIHPRIRLLLERCLKKDPRNRYSSISDARVDIQEVLADPGGVLAQPAAAAEPRRKLRNIIPWAAAALVLGLVIAGVAVWNLKKAPSSEPRRVIRLDHVLPDGQQIILPRLGAGHTLAVSPDGSQFIYSTTKGLYRRSVNELNAVLIPGTEENPQSPFFSPDGQWVGYWSQTDNKLKKIPIRGGAPVTLCDVDWLVGAYWHSDNTVVFADVAKGALRVSANGGAPEVLHKGLLYSPQLLPDGKSLIFSDSLGGTKVKSLQTGALRELFRGNFARYLPTGHMIYRMENSRNIVAVPFDLQKLEVKSGPVAVIEGAALFAVSDSGTLAYLPEERSASAASPRVLMWVDRKGNEKPLSAPANNYGHPKISPDGTKIAVTVGGDNPDIWIWDLVRENMTRLTFDKAIDACPLWSPDGKRIAFQSVSADKTRICWKAADGTEEVEELAAVSGQLLVPRFWADNGKALVIEEGNIGKGETYIALLPLEGDRTRRVLLREQYMVTHPRLSPDHKYMAYSSLESGRLEIYVRPFPEVNKGKWQISTGGLEESPLWSPDGRELFYVGSEGLMAVPVDTASGFSSGKPQVIYRGPFVSGYMESIPYDLSPDGKRFLMIKETAPAATAEGPRKINVVLNWFEELKQRVPTQ